MSDTIEGKKPDGTSAESTPKGEETKTPLSPEAKVAADKAAADAKLLDGNGNLKSAEVLAEEAAAEAKATAPEDESEGIKTKVTAKAKQMEDLVAAAGVDPGELAATADKETGELSIDHKAKLIEHHGEAIADLIENNVKKMMTDTRKYSQAKDKAVFDQVELEFKGVTDQKGSETWKELAGWVKKNMDTNTRKEYNAMLSAGGIQAKLAVKEMVNAFKKDNDMTIPAQLVEGEYAPPSPTKFITRAEYMKALDKLQKAGHDYNTSPQIAALNKQRTRSIQSGK